MLEVFAPYNYISIHILNFHFHIFNSKKYRKYRIQLIHISKQKKGQNKSDSFFGTFRLRYTTFDNVYRLYSILQLSILSATQLNSYIGNMSAQEQILALMATMTAEQLTALQETTKKIKKNAKNEAQILKETQMKELKEVWEEIEWAKPDEMSNDARLQLLCECYGLKVAHKRGGRHPERPMGDPSKRSKGNYSQIVCMAEEKFKYEIMGKEWRGRDLFEGEGKSKKYIRKEWSLQIHWWVEWAKFTKEEKKAWNFKFVMDWKKQGDDPRKVPEPTERTNSKVFIEWWKKHIVAGKDGWEFKGEYDCSKIRDYYNLAIGGGGAKPATKPAKKTAKKPAGAKKSKASKTAPAHSAKKKQKKEDKYTALGRKVFEDAKKLADATPKTKQKTTRKRRTKKEMAEAKAMGMEDINVAKHPVAELFEEEDLSVFSDDE